MKAMLIVGLGGLVGSVARYKLGGWVLHLTSLEKFPWSTFTVNVLGCFAVGLLAGLVEKLEWFAPDTRLFLFTGLLGGFTTFSAFGLETWLLLQSGREGAAVSYALASVALGVAGVVAGAALARGAA